MEEKMEIETDESGRYREIGGAGAFGMRLPDDRRLWMAWSETCNAEIDVMKGVIDDFGTLVCVYRHHIK